MILGDFLLCGKLQVLHTKLRLANVNIAKTTIKQDLARKEAKLQTELFIVDKHIAPEVEQGIVEIGQRFFKVA